MTPEPRLSVEGDAVLRFAPHIRFRFDEVRQAWIVLAPERLMLPDEQAVEILQLIDGKRAVDDVIDDVVERYRPHRVTARPCPTAHDEEHVARREVRLVDGDEARRAD